MDNRKYTGFKTTIIALLLAMLILWLIEKWIEYFEYLE